MNSRAAIAFALPLALIPVAAAPAATSAAPRQDAGPVGHRMPQVATMTGSGGAAASVDPVATQVAIDVLARGGTAADAAVAATAALNVVEPYATGLGGGGFFVHYDARTKKVETIDGRETAPASMTETSFLEPDGTPMNFDKAVNSGLSVGVPGNPAIWQMALKRWGKRSFSQMLAPAEEIARRGFVVDEAFSTATADNAKRFSQFPATAAVFLPGGRPVQPGHVLRQPDLARTYHLLRTQGPDALYRGPIGKAVVATVNRPATAPGVTVPSGGMTMTDLSRYRALLKKPVVSDYKGLTIYGMSTPSGGGTAVAEILNLMEESERQTGVPVSRTDDVQYLHRFAEASAASFADRNRWVADVPDAPISELVSQPYAAERACGFDPNHAAPRPIAFGTPDGRYEPCGTVPPGLPGKVNEGASTTHLTVADKWGNVASYTSTIEQFGGSGMVVPGYGFLLNNQLTDFEFVAPTKGVPHPNLPAPGKRPRSSMAPTIVVKDGRPIFAAGAAGGSTIITTTAQILLGFLERDLTPVGAVNAPRLSSRNTAAGAEPQLMSSATGAALRAMGQPMTMVTTLGRATAISMPARGVFVPAAERTRGGGGSAMVVKPRR